MNAIGADASLEAERVFVETFQKGVVPEDITVVKAHENEIENMLVQLKIVVSKMELTRLLEAGCVRNVETGEKVHSFKIQLPSPVTLRIGKRRFIRLEIDKK